MKKIIIAVLIAIFSVGICWAELKFADHIANGKLENNVWKNIKYFYLDFKIIGETPLGKYEEELRSYAKIKLINSISNINIIDDSSPLKDSAECGTVKISIWSNEGENMFVDFIMIELTIPEYDKYNGNLASYTLLPGGQYSGRGSLVYSKIKDELKKNIDNLIEGLALAYYKETGKIE
ncbi:MAG: hypothetical protein KKA19_08455 [Candidatus Margulisbacteria bacterium]|nr:hypothetical protein [Candidatus Margulisiibacteriota bacterium]